MGMPALSKLAQLCAALDRANKGKGFHLSARTAAKLLTEALGVAIADTRAWKLLGILAGKDCGFLRVDKPGTRGAHGMATSFRIVGATITKAAAIPPETETEIEAHHGD